MMDVAALAPFVAPALSILSLLVSVTSAVAAWWAVQISRQIALKTTALQLHNTADDMCEENPKLYEFHGITLEELKQSEVSATELQYVARSFDAGSAYHLLEDELPTLTEFRCNMLQHPKVADLEELHCRTTH